MKQRVPSRFSAATTRTATRHHFIFFHFITTTGSSAHYGLAIYIGPSNE